MSQRPFPANIFDGMAEKIAQLVKTYKARSK